MAQLAACAAALLQQSQKLCWFKVENTYSGSLKFNCTPSSFFVARPSQFLISRSMIIPSNLKPKMLRPYRQRANIERNTQLGQRHLRMVNIGIAAWTRPSMKNQGKDMEVARMRIAKSPIRFHSEWGSM